MRRPFDELPSANRFPVEHIPLDRLPEQIPFELETDIDALIVNVDTFSTSENYELLTNQGGDQLGTLGTFLASPLDGAPTFSFAIPTDVALGDVDGDGDLDALVTHLSVSGASNQLLINQGGDDGGTEGTFVASNLDDGFDFSTAVAFGDVDGDGDLDAIIANYGTNTLLTNEDGVFVASDLDGGSRNSEAVAFGDFDGDGDLDALIANTSGQASQLLTNEDGVFVASDLDGVVVTSNDIAVGDLDGDGDLDAIIATNGTGQLLTNEDGVFVASDLDILPGTSQAVALGDLDGDGDLDAIVTNSTPGRTDKLLINQGGDDGGTEGVFIASDLDDNALRQAFDVDLGDVDGDGDLDALFTNSGTNELFINQGGDDGGTEGTFVASDLDDSTLLSDSEAAALGDVDGDGAAPAVDANGFPNINPDGLLPEAPVPSDVIA